MYQHLSSLLKQWCNFPLGLGKERLNIVSPQTWGPNGSLIHTVACLNTSGVSRMNSLRFIFSATDYFREWLARPFVPFVANVRPFSPPLSKVPVNNLDYHANSVNTRLFFVLLSAGDLHTGRWQRDLCTAAEKANVQTPRCEKTPAAGKVMHWKCSLSSAHHQRKPELSFFYSAAPAVFHSSSI